MMVVIISVEKHLMQKSLSPKQKGISIYEFALSNLMWNWLFNLSDDKDMKFVLDPFNVDIVASLPEWNLDW